MIFREVNLNKDMCEQVERKCKSRCSLYDTCELRMIANAIDDNVLLLGALFMGELRGAQANEELQIIEDNNKIIGFLQFRLNKRGDKHLTISMLYLYPLYRGMGYGHMIIEYLSRKYNRTILAGCQANTSAEKFWSNVGEKCYSKLSKKGNAVNFYNVKTKQIIDDLPKTLKKE